MCWEYYYQCMKEGEGTCENEQRTDVKPRGFDKQTKMIFAFSKHCPSWNPATQKCTGYGVVKVHVSTNGLRVCDHCTIKMQIEQNPLLWNVSETQLDGMREKVRENRAEGFKDEKAHKIEVGARNTALQLEQERQNRNATLRLQPPGTKVPSPLDQRLDAMGESYKARERERYEQQDREERAARQSSQELVSGAGGSFDLARRTFAVDMRGSGPPVSSANERGRPREDSSIRSQRESRPNSRANNGRVPASEPLGRPRSSSREGSRDRGAPRGGAGKPVNSKGKAPAADASKKP